MRRVKIYSVKLVVPRGFRQKYEGTTKSKDGNIEAVIPPNYIDAILRDLGFQPERRRQRFREVPATMAGKRAESGAALDTKEASVE